MTGAEQRRLELFVVTVFLYLVPIMIMQTVRLKIQQLILSASSASHMAVTAFYLVIILNGSIAEIRQNGELKLINKYSYDSLL